MICGPDESFLLPAREIPDQPGPMTLSGGLRQFARDPEAWLTRFQRSTRFLSRAVRVDLLVPGDGAKQLKEGFAAKDTEFALTAMDAHDALEDAARLASGSRINHLAPSFPLSNPFIPRKRFSHAFIVIPCLLILLSPLATRALVDWQFERRKERVGHEAAPYRPLEQAIKDAEKRLETAKQNYLETLGFEQQLADRRRPLYAAIHLSYFFSKYAGSSVRLESIVDKGGSLEIRGWFKDPEAEVALNNAFQSFAADKNLRVVRNDATMKKSPEGQTILTLELVVDYTGMIR